MVHPRNVPNSGNLGSIEIYPVAVAVDGLDSGIYHFDTVAHHLSVIRKGVFSDWLRHCILYQVEFARAAAALVITSAVGRLTQKYGPRGYRLAHLDAGHVSAHIYLVATALGVQVCATAGFIDAALDAALGLDGYEHASMLVVLVGPQPPHGGP